MKWRISNESGPPARDPFTDAIIVSAELTVVNFLLVQGFRLVVAKQIAATVMAASVPPTLDDFIAVIQQKVRESGQMP